MDDDDKKRALGAHYLVIEFEDTCIAIHLISMVC